MEEKLKTIYKFLSSNRRYNKELQNKSYRSIINPHQSIEGKVSALLYSIANSQSQPRIDKLAKFYRLIFNEMNCLSSFTAFIKHINKEMTKVDFNSLFQGMKTQPGWGNKTAALLTKTIYHLHNGHYDPDLKIWNDVPSTISSNDKLFLPVDSVIIAIFNKLGKSKIKWNFNNINKTIASTYKPVEIEVWDDLWFWGFITQIGSGNSRNFKWNENKYWILKESSKDKNDIDEIKAKAKEFLTLIK